MGTFGRRGREVNHHTFNHLFAGHLNNGPHIAVAQVMVPGLDIRHAGGIKGSRAAGFVSDSCRSECDCVKVAILGEGSLNNCGAAVVGHPAGHTVKISNIIPMAIKARDQERVYLRVRDEKDVCQG
jgi:hypothetical protein